MIFGYTALFRWFVNILSKTRIKTLHRRIKNVTAIVFTAFACTCYAETNNLISDYDFTNQKYTMQGVYAFCKSFKNNPLNYSEIEIIVRYCHVYTINPLPILIKMQMESDLLERIGNKKSIKYLKIRAMGYGMAKNFRRQGLKHYVYGGYQIQVFHAIKRFREFLQEWKPGEKKYIVDLKKDIIPKNAATYALYRYTPFYGKHNVYNWEYDAVGNMAFVLLYEKYKKGWDKIKNISSY